MHFIFAKGTLTVEMFSCTKRNKIEVSYCPKNTNNSMSTGYISEYKITEQVFHLKGKATSR